MFEGLSEKGLVNKVVENDEEDGEEEEMQREVGEFENKRGNEMTQNENESVNVCVVVVAEFQWVGERYFCVIFQ